MIGGFALQTISGVWLMGIDLNVDTGTLMVNSLVQGIAIGVIWVPLTLVTFSTIGSANLAEGDGGLPSAAQHRLELLHLDLRRRDRARHQRQLQPHWSSW